MPLLLDSIWPFSKSGKERLELSRRGWSWGSVESNSTNWDSPRVGFLDLFLRFLQRELESLRDSEQELQTLQQEVDDDTTEVIPSAMWVGLTAYWNNHSQHHTSPPHETMIVGEHWSHIMNSMVQLDKLLILQIRGPVVPQSDQDQVGVWHGATHSERRYLSLHNYFSITLWQVTTVELNGWLMWVLVAFN